MMKNTVYICLYVCAVLAATLIHHPGWILFAICVVVAVSGNGRRALLWRAVVMVAVIAAVISVGYLMMQWLTGSIDWFYLIRFNSRILLLALVTAWFVRDVDIEAALMPWPKARRWAAILRGQIMMFQALIKEYRKAQRSRSAEDLSFLRRYRCSGALGLAALDKAMSRSESLRDAMRSRGAMDV